MKRPACAALLLALAALAAVSPSAGAAGSAELLKPGDRFPGFAAEDQHGAAYRFQPGTRAVLIAFDMGSARAANKVLAALGSGYLDDRQAVYVANIHGMPGIGRRFALPKMRKYPHRIVLADDETLLSPFPQQDGRITVVRLDDAGVVVRIDFWDPKNEGLEAAHL